MCETCDACKAGENEKGVPLIEVTPEMIKAGLDEAKAHCLGGPLSDLVRNIYIAMILEKAQQLPRP